MNSTSTQSSTGQSSSTQNGKENNYNYILKLAKISALYSNIRIIPIIGTVRILEVGSTGQANTTTIQQAGSTGQANTTSTIQQVESTGQANTTSTIQANTTQRGTLLHIARYLTINGEFLHLHY